jgi:hypothetical protein
MITAPPISALVATYPPAVALLKTGTGPIRFYMFGEANQNTPRPYAVWQTIGGSPENYINQRPDVDDWVCQVDVYALTASSARTIAYTLIEAMEGAAYVTSYTIEMKEPDTNLFRLGFIVEFMTTRT